LEICGENFRLQPIPLLTVRPFVIEEISLDEQPNLNNNQNEIMEFLVNKVEAMIEQTKKDFPQDSSNNEPKLPLIRLKV
jgi:double-strand break repair protein MRE11